MSIITKALKGTCVYWPPNDPPVDNYGQPAYGTAVELDCRWEDVTIEYLSANGTREMSRAMVMVESDVVVGGVLFNGELTDLDDATTPKNNNGAWEIKRFDKTPNLRYTEYLREAYL